MKFWYYLYIVLACLVTSTLVAQTNHNATQISQSLPSNEVYDLFLDSKGFLWIGHSRGISRFDGTKYITYTHPVQNNMSLSNICEDGNGTIWTNNFGAQVFYIKNNRLHLLNEYDWNKQQNFPTILPYKGDRIVATDTSGLFEYHINTKKARIIKLPDGEGIDHANIFQIANNVFIVKDTIWYCYTNSKFEKILPIYKNEKSKLYTKYLGQIKDTIFLEMPRKTAFGAFTVDTVTKRYTMHRTIDLRNENYKISTLSPQQAWLFSNNKSIFLGTGTDVLQGKKASDIITDRAGNIWISSLEQGVQKLTKTAFPFTKTEATVNGVNDVLNSLTIHRQQVWAASRTGRLYCFQNNRLQTMAKNTSPEAFQSVASFQNKLYVGSTQLQFYSDSTKTLNVIANTSSIKCIELREKEIWVGDAYGLISLKNTSLRNIVRAKRCKAITYHAATKTMYGVFIDGVFAIRNKEITELQFQNKSIFGTSICHKDSLLFIATISNGVLVFNNGKFINQISIQNGLPSNAILKVKSFGNSIWILTPNGLDEWQPTSQKIVHHATSVPFLENIMTDFVVMNNTAYVTDGKVLYTYPLQQRRANNQVTAYVDEVFANGIKIDTAANNYFALPNDTNNLQFLLSGISDIGIDYSFKYRLVGEKSQWISVPAAQYSVNFPAMAAGNYVFEVIAVASDGTESAPVQITFSIAKGWWQNWWLWLALAFVAFLVIAIIVALRIENIHQKNKLIIEKMNLQAYARDGMLAAIRSQMNPHFIFNALNTIQSYIYTNDEDKANSYLGKFSDLIRQILDASQLSHIPLSREISMLQLYVDLELMRFENTLHAVITVDPSVPTDQIDIPPMMVQPYVENAIKHGLLHKPADRHLSINISRNNDYLHITIFDNGVGRAKSQQINNHRAKSHQSFATKANQNRLELLNQNRSRKIELFITDHVNHLGVGTGTTVLLKLPL